jgi:hypothetical protein
MRSNHHKLPQELGLAYVNILLFITAQYVVNERPWNQIFRIVGLLAFAASLLLLARKRGRNP